MRKSFAVFLLATSLTLPILAHADKKNHGVIPVVIGGGAVINEAQQSEGLITDPIDGSDHDLVSITGGGTFVAARMTKQGGDTGITSVELVIDGKTIVGRNYAALNNWGMTQNNPFGVVLLHGNGVDTVTIGFQQPIKFKNSLVLRTHVGENGVVQMIGTVIYGQ